MATTQVEAALGAVAGVEECTVFGVEVPDTGGRAGMAAVKLLAGDDIDVQEPQGGAANQAYGPDVADPLYVLCGREEGYLPFYDGYAEEVAAGRRP